MNFTQVLTDLQEMQEERQEALRAAQYDLDQAWQRLDYATLDADMRLWTLEERDEYDSAVAGVLEARRAYEKAKEAL